MNTVIGMMGGMVRIVSSACTFATCAAAFAQPYPSKPLHWIVPYAPGGGTDTVSRAMAPQMQASLRQPIVVENRPSATGIIAVEATAKAAPDGYTLLTTGNELVLMKLLYRKLGFDPLGDLTPVGLMARAPTVLLVHESVPATSLKEFIAYIRERPGKLNYGSPGTGHGYHIGMEMFLRDTDTKMVHVPYKGTALVLQDLLAGRIHAIMYLPGAQLLAQVNKGVLRVLAAGAGKRLPNLPQVPTFDEGGVANFDGDGFLIVMTTAGTPKDIIERLGREVSSAVRSAVISKTLDTLALVPRTSSPEESRQFLNNEFEKWGKVVKSLALTLD